MFNTIKRVYGPFYIGLNAVIAIFYYILLIKLVAIQNHGFVITSIPKYMLAILSITSAITLTIAIFSIGNTRRNSAKATASTASIGSVIVGGLVTGCGCQVSILASLIGVIAGSSGAVAANIAIADNAVYIIAAIILLNIFMAIYYLDKLSKPACIIKKGDQNESKKGKRAKAEGAA